MPSDDNLTTAHSVGLGIVEAPEDASDALDTLLNNLQGNGSKIRADAGLARLREFRLRKIQLGARARSATCLQAAQSLSRLLTHALENPVGTVSADDLVGITRHLHGLTADMQRWQALADNAAFYRLQRKAAHEVAQRWLQSAQQTEEWPV